MSDTQTTTRDHTVGAVYVDSRLRAGAFREADLEIMAAFASQAAAFGVVDAKDANVEGYVTEQALDGLFKVIAQQEKGIRENPAGAATSLAKKVFGAL